MFLNNRGLVRYTVFSLIGIALLNFLYLISFRDSPAKPSPTGLFENLSLTQEQCSVVFPGLMKEIDEAVARGPIALKKAPDYQGQVEGRVRDGKLYIISAHNSESRDMLYDRTSALHQLHRAIITSPEPLPDTLFTLSVLDSPRKHTWSYSRSNSPKNQENVWVMPHFSFWSWPLPFIGPVDAALSSIQAIESSIPWDDKIDKAVWRGTAWFNGPGNPQLRQNMLAVAKGKEWGDVQVLEWNNNAVNASNALRIEDFCKYKYILYTEGVTYSGRLPFHQSCRSVVLTPPITYLLHTTHLIRPYFYSSLPSSFTSTSASGNPRWPTNYPPTEANIIFIKNDWADLEQAISWLRENPGIARGIAERQREDIVDKGYLSDAAEVCYWRALVRGWASVVSEGEGWDEGEGSKEGVRWETFSLTGRTG